jgi:hypothetical protein
MSEGNGHGVLILGADGRPAGKGEFARAAAVQHAVNILLGNDKKLAANQNAIATDHATLMEAFNQLVDRVAELEAKLKDGD